jgi:hypothetical protein
MQLEPFRPRVDAPIRVQLDDAPARAQLKEGKFGLDYLHSVNRGQGKMYLPAQAHEALVRSGARPGDEVQICKTLHGKAVSFDIHVLTAGVARPLPPAAAAAPQPIRTNGSTNGHTNGAAPAQGKPASIAATAEPAVVQQTGEQRIGRRVKVCGRIALDAIADWTAYGTKIGVPMQFESDDVRALAITLLIETMRREAGGPR